MLDPFSGAATTGLVARELGRNYIGLELSAEPVAIDSRLGTARLGAYITDLDPDSPAAQAGLQPGDIITAFDGQAFRTPGELLKMIFARAPGTQVRVQVLRDGRVAEVAVTVGKRPDAP